VAGDDEAAVRDAVQAWLAAIADGDADGACAALAEPARRQLAAREPGGDCIQAVSRLAAVLGPDRRAELRRLAVEDVAFPAARQAIATFGGGMRLTLREDRGRWRISDLASVLRTGTGGAFPPPPTTFVPTPPRAPRS
jgi:hypothetical protein